MLLPSIHLSVSVPPMHGMTEHISPLPKPQDMSIGSTLLVLTSPRLRREPRKRRTTITTIIKMKRSLTRWLWSKYPATIVPLDEEGHLYGAIIAAMRNYHSVKKAGKFAEYHRAFAVHYIGDLSQPLHNVPNDEFNKKHHPYNDGIVDADILNNLGEIEKRMYEIKLRSDNFEEDLAKEIARIANISRQLAFKMIAENRDMTKEEAYVQLGHSASLLKAVLSVP